MYYRRADMSRRVRGKPVRPCVLVLLFCGILPGLATTALGSVSTTNAPSVARAALTIPENATAFELKETSVFDLPETVRGGFLLVTYSACGTEPDEAVRRYPVFTSDKPLYGSFQVGGEQRKPETGYHYPFAIDESRGTGQGYDRIYIDLNLNGDLADDACRHPMKDVPEKALVAPGSYVAQVCFDPVTVQVTPEDDPQHRLEVIPRFFAEKSGRSFATLMPTTVHTGTIRIGWKKFDAVLGHSRGILGWFNHPTTGLFLLPAGQPGDSPFPRWYGGTQLKAMHRSLGTYYRLSATPNGDRLFVWPYQGPFGELKIRAGERKVWTMLATGILESRDAAISLTEGFGGNNAPTSDSYRLPVGDYGPLMLNVKLDSLSCLLLRNSHADGKPRGRAEQGPPVYAIKIREDKPFVLDFSGKPQVVFASPAKDHRVKLGSELEVKAVLVDPALDIMFRAISQGGQLNPRVVIKRADGQVVAEGTMPFG